MRKKKAVTSGAKSSNAEHVCDLPYGTSESELCCLKTLAYVAMFFFVFFNEFVFTIWFYFIYLFSFHNDKEMCLQMHAIWECDAYSVFSLVCVAL